MSSGHLCEAEAPTEPTGETADPYFATSNYKFTGGHGEFAIRQTLLSAYEDIFAQPQTADPSATTWHLPYFVTG